MFNWPCIRRPNTAQKKEHLSLGQQSEVVMRCAKLLGLALAFSLVLGFVDAKPDKGEPKKPEVKFKPVEIKAELTKEDGPDEKSNQPAKKYTFKLAKDKTYVFEMGSKDFDAISRLLDKNNKEVAEDDDSGGELNSRIVYSPSETGDFHLMAGSLDGDVGNFTLRVWELAIKGEAKVREVPEAGFELGAALGENDQTDLGKRTKVVSVQLKAELTYLFEIESEDFDCQLYVFDARSKMLGQAPDKLIATSPAGGVHNLVIATFDESVGKFNLKARAFTIKGEEMPRAVGKNGISVTGNIGDNDTTEIGKLGKVFSVTLKAGEKYTIDLESGSMDSYLYLFDAKTKLLAQDDDSGGDLNSRITFTAERDGVHHIIATTLLGDETGEFTLRVRKD
jgi:hypothetical protein